jgi:dolichyl-phosphate beta-glucosyltransferase
MRTCCIIIPCYNEAGRLNFDLIGKYLALQEKVILVFVNDGSADNTIELIDAFKKQDPARIFVVNLKTNSGKAEAIRHGVLFALKEINPDYIGYLDADLSTPFSEMNGMLTYLEANKLVKVIFGSRVKRLGSKIERSLIRHYIGRIFATFVSMMLGLPVYDSQCGAKVMTAEKASALFKEEFLTAWLFDIELLFRHKNIFGVEKTLTEVYEYPLFEWSENKGSKIRFYHAMAIPFNMVSIVLHYTKSRE